VSRSRGLRSTCSRSGSASFVRLAPANTQLLSVFIKADELPFNVRTLSALPLTLSSLLALVLGPRVAGHRGRWVSMEPVRRRDLDLFLIHCHDLSPF
jgi:hypothetical protein